MSHWILIVFVRTDRSIEQGWTIRFSWSEKLPNLSLLIVEEGLEIFRNHAQNDFCFFPFRFNLTRLTDMGCDICPESLYLFKPQTSQIMTYLLVFWKSSTYLVFRNEHVRLPSHFCFHCKVQWVCSYSFSFFLPIFNLENSIYINKSFS